MAHVSTRAPPPWGRAAPSHALRAPPTALHPPIAGRRRGAAAAAAPAPPPSAPGPGEDDGSIVVGIDLGTTNSAVAMVVDGAPVAIPDAGGRPTLPSVVAFAADGAVLVGEPARAAAAANPRATFSSVKRLIGRRLADVREDAERAPFGVAADADGFAVLELPAGAAGATADPSGGPAFLYPEEVSAHVLRALLARAEAATGRAVRRAVVSVPAYFGDAERDATVAAGRLAGLDAVRLIREPVAAALAYGLDPSVTDDRTVLVFDLGGGTLDVSLLEVGGGVVEVLSTGGDARLGGDDWDAAVAAHLAAEALAPAGVDVGADPAAAAGLAAAARAAKEALSTEAEVVVTLPSPRGPLRARLTRQALEGLTAHLFRRARLPLDAAAWQAGVDLAAAVGAADKAAAKRGGGRRAAGAAPVIRPKQRQPVSEVLLVGGATRMPAVRRFVRNMTGLEPRPGGGVDPDLAVALGAALHAGVLEGRVADVMVMDVWQASLMRAFAGRLQRGEGGEDGDGDGDFGLDSDEELDSDGELLEEELADEGEEAPPDDEV